MNPQNNDSPPPTKPKRGPYRRQGYVDWDIISPILKDPSEFGELRLVGES